MLDVLLGQLNGEAVTVFDDGSKPRLKAPGCRLIRSSKNNGKKGYWSWVNALIRQARHDGGTVVILPDDARFVDGGLSSAKALFEGLEKELPGEAICLNLLRDQRDQSWTGYRSRHYNADLLSAGWVDGAFVCNQKFLGMFHLIPSQPPSRWRANPLAGSGVWEFVSRNNFKWGAKFFQVKKSLLIHGDHPSLMNPEARERQPIINK